MPTLATCNSCGKKLRIPDNVTAAKARCPGCGAAIALTKTGITSTPPASPPREDENRRSTSDRDGIVPDAPADDQPRPRKKKRKRPRPTKSSEGVPLWVWGALAAVFLLLVGLVSAVVIHAGYGPQLLTFAIIMAILLPVSVVILVLSMFLASAVLGGVDFGQAHIAIPKAGALLLVVNLISMIPFAGPLLALLVWFAGLMGLFNLDFVEARTLVFINWGLNTLFKYLLLAALLSGLRHTSTDDDPFDKPPPPNKTSAVKKIGAVVARRGSRGSSSLGRRLHVREEFTYTQEVNRPPRCAEKGAIPCLTTRMTRSIVAPPPRACRPPRRTCCAWVLGAGFCKRDWPDSPDFPSPNCADSGRWPPARADRHARRPSSFSGCPVVPATLICGIPSRPLRARFADPSVPLPPRCPASRFPSICRCKRGSWTS